MIGFKAVGNSPKKKFFNHFKLNGMSISNLRVFGKKFTIYYFKRMF